MPDDPTSNPIDRTTDPLERAPERPLFIRLREAFPIAWKHDELFRYALVLSLLAWLVILVHLGNGTTR